MATFAPSVSFLCVVLTRSFSIAKEKTGGSLLSPSGRQGRSQHSCFLQPLTDSAASQQATPVKRGDQVDNKPEARQGAVPGLAHMPHRVYICTEGQGAVMYGYCPRVRVSTAMLKHYEQSKSKRKRFIWLPLLHHILH